MFIIGKGNIIIRIQIFKKGIKASIDMMFFWSLPFVILMLFILDNA